jgi:hypothetical protein
MYFVLIVVFIDVLLILNKIKKNKLIYMLPPHKKDGGRNYNRMIIILRKDKIEINL